MVFESYVMCSCISVIDFNKEIIIIIIIVIIIITAIIIIIIVSAIIITISIPAIRTYPY